MSLRIIIGNQDEAVVYDSVTEMPLPVPIFHGTEDMDALQRATEFINYVLENPWYLGSNTETYSTGRLLRALRRLFPEDYPKAYTTKPH